MTGAEALDAIEAYLAALEAAALDPDSARPRPPDLGAAELHAREITRARALLVEVELAEERLLGLRRRVQGELAGMSRPRAQGDMRRPSPRTLDVIA